MLRASPALPLHLLNELIERIGMTPEDAIELTLEEALQRMNDYWTGVADSEQGWSLHLKVPAESA